MYTRHLVRVLSVCLLGSVLALCGPPSMAVAKKKSASACQKLSKRKDIATSRKLVTVMRGHIEKGRISACVLPRGKVRTLSSWSDVSDGATVVDTAGTWVLVAEDNFDADFGGVSHFLTRIEVRHNRTLTLAGASCHFTEAPCQTGTGFGQAAIAPSGAGALEQIEPSDVTTLQAFNAAGTFTKLADGAVDELRVTSTQIGWSQAGLAHTAPLP